MDTSLRVLALSGPGAAIRLRASPAEPHLLRLEDGTETPGVGLIALRPGRTVVGPGRLFAVEFDPTRSCVTAVRLSEEQELYVNGIEVVAGTKSPLAPHPLLPGSLIVSGRCLYQFCWSAARSTTAASGTRGLTGGRFLSGRAEVAGLRRENSDLAARARDLLEAAGRTDGLTVRVSAALGRLEAALFASAAAGPQQQQQQPRDQRNESCSCPPVAAVDDTPPAEAALLAKPCRPVEADSRHAVLQLAAPEVQRAISGLATPPPPPTGTRQDPQAPSRSRRLQRRRAHCQLLMGVAADVGDKLVALLGGINANCGPSWLFDGLCDLVAEIGWAMSVVEA